MVNLQMCSVRIVKDLAQKMKSGKIMARRNSFFVLRR